MKKLLSLFILMLSPMLANAQTVSDVQIGGCLSETRAEEAQIVPTIVLTKEGNVLSVQLLNYESNCGTTDFIVTPKISTNEGETWSLTVNVDPVVPQGMWCTCPFNVSFTVRDLEPNSFYLKCWWYEGMVELTDGEPLVLEYKMENVTIDGISFKLIKVMHKAMLMNWPSDEDELRIPSEVTFEGESYTVTCIDKDAFWNIENATKIVIPKTITSMDIDYDAAIYANPFRECKSLEWIEVEEGCPLFSSVDGVLFAENKTMLLGYPIASPRETYTVPKGVTNIRSGAFVHNKYLRKLVIPEEVTYLGWHLFNDTKSLEELYIRGVLEPECMSTLFEGMDTKVVVYVQSSEVEKFQAVYKGPVYPLPEQTIDEDYLPFVEKGKKWRIITMETPEQQQGKLPFIQWPPLDDTDAPSEHYCHFEKYEMYEEVMRNGKTYTHTFRLDDKVNISQEAGLYREENRCVYVYDEKAGRELLVYDFSLKEGDTFTYEYGFDQPVKCKVLKLGWLDEGPEIVSTTALTSAGTMETKHRRLRIWTIGCDNGSGQYEEFATWVECVGVLENMFSMFDHDKGTSYLAYVERNSPDNWENEFLPFSICNIYDEFGQIHGCNLPTGEADHSEWHHQLTYELEGDRLHVYGKANTQCGPNNYAYFIEKATDDPLVHKIEFIIQDVDPVATCMALHATDFYVPGFDPHMNYIVVDNQGGEHPVINKTSQTAYRPLIEEGKVWTYHYYNDMTGKDFYESLMVSGDTVVDDKSYKKIVDVTTGRVDCAIREEGRKVYATYPHYSGEKLIYDFGLNVGDAFQLYDDNNGSDPNAWAMVVSVDTIVVGSRAFRALDVRSNDMKGWPNWWVEGIGGEYGLTANCLLAGNSYCFSSCKLGEDTLFTNHDFQTLGTIPSIETQMAYYYYKGNKIPLTLNENKVVVSIPKEYDGVCKRIRANLPVLSTIKDGVFDSFIIPRSDFERLASQDFWKEDAKSVVLTSSYYTEDKAEVFETPYLNVKLKKEEDASLLASYAERYRLKIDGNSSYMPLWYILHVTPESEKSPLKCANEIFESGEFASAVPDLSSDDDFEIGVAYRPFVEDGKVWKVGTIPTVSGNPVQVVDYYYFAGDTIIGGKTCKQMMCQRYVGSDFSDTAPSLTKVGAWYEEDKKVYRYYARDKQFRLWYDFSADANDTLQIYEDHPPYIISPRKTGGIKGFKGIYRDVMMTYEGELLNYNISTWMEGVGNIAGPIYCVYIGEELYKDFLMSCTVGDEVIYLNDAYEDGATPEAARKDRIDFTHTIKIKPKSRSAREAEAKSLYGEYNSQQLGINLNALDEAYQVSITDEAGKTVYEKIVNAGSIVGLNIDISAYAKGRYTVTVENSNESFTGEIDTRTTGIEDNVRIEKLKSESIYNLQGQRISSLRKGLNIVSGRKIFVK